VRFDWTINVGSLLAILTVLIGILFAWRDHEWRVRNLESWRERYEHMGAVALENIALLRQSTASLDQIAKGVDRRLIMLEDRMNHVTPTRATQ
jgi:hypothetical protein